MSLKEFLLDAILGGSDFFCSIFHNINKNCVALNESVKLLRYKNSPTKHQPELDENILLTSLKSWPAWVKTPNEVRTFRAMSSKRIFWKTERPYYAFCIIDLGDFLVQITM